MSKLQKSPKAKKLTLSPEIYKKYLTEVQLIEVSQINSYSQLNEAALEKVFQNNFSPPAISLDTKVDHKTLEKVHLIYSEWELSSEFAKEKLFFLKITSKYKVMLSIKAELPEEFWEIYLNTTLPLIVFPYFREFVQSTTQRMNIPPLTLPILFK
jgi:preprotein translocase subunit SecB